MNVMFRCSLFTKKEMRIYLCFNHDQCYGGNVHKGTACVTITKLRMERGVRRFKWLVTGRWGKTKLGGAREQSVPLRTKSLLSVLQKRERTSLAYIPIALSTVLPKNTYVASKSCSSIEQYTYSFLQKSQRDYIRVFCSSVALTQILTLQLPLDPRDATLTHQPKFCQILAYPSEILHHIIRLYPQYQTATAI